MSDALPSEFHPKPANDRWPLIALALLCLVGFGVMEYLAINQWITGRWYLADVGTIQYSLINTWDGDFLRYPGTDVSFFAFHFEPFLFLLMPLVWLSPYPIPLVTTYQLALALTPVPIFALARQRGLPPYLGLALGMWFLCNHFTGSVQLANHYESIYILFALCTMAMIRSTRRWAFWACAVLTLSVKEDATAWILAYAAWEWFFHRTEPLVRHRTVRLGLLCICWAVAAVISIYFHARGESDNAATYVDRMNGISLGWDNISVLLVLIATSGGLCLLNWRTALLLLVPLPIILGNFYFTRNLIYYYSYPFLPFLALATVAGVAQLVKHLHKIEGPAMRRPALLLALFLVVLGAIQYLLPTRTDNYLRFPHFVYPRDKIRNKIAREVLPRDVPVALQSNLWGVTPWRFDTVLLFDEKLEDRHWVFMDFDGMHGLTRDQLKAITGRIEQEMQSGRRNKVYDKFNFLILGPASKPAQAESP